MKNENKEFPTKYLIGIEADLLLIQDSMIADRHNASGDNYEPKDAFNQIGGVVMSFSLNGWLRHGMETVLINKGLSVCHPSEASANLKKKDVYERDLSQGYHEKGSCLEGKKECIIHEMFGGFENRPSIFMKHPIRYSPIRASLDYSEGQVEGHYRRIVRQISSRNDEDGREPFRSMESDAIANVEGTWKLSFRNLKPEYIGLLIEAIEYLNENREEFMHQLGGGRNFGGGIMKATLINPLYDNAEVNRVYDRAKKGSKSKDMKAKDKEWEKIQGAFKDELNNCVKQLKA